MKIFLPVLVMLILCSMCLLTEGQVSTNKKCSNTSQCYKTCEKVVGVAAGKCMNGKCICYP
uniref:Potassium channel toxin alpha-KTx 15.9 n=1 Tax=Lychas mucronatus TaxID=172552 RepID=KA159_LYCMC|nr:RecName: Full=Potassium channel toxin alpha-KTx 15.9; AltName: Full=Neurotoxin KTx9; Flags: Precursor [Lychas mucronatus]ABY26664.1 neurotoxin KTx9 [Lychas mucronatus]